MGLDIHIERLEVKEVKDEVARWHNNHDLLTYIRENIHQYGDDEYDQDIELSLRDLEKIMRFIKNQDKMYDETFIPLGALYAEKVLDPDIKIIFNANW